MTLRKIVTGEANWRGPRRTGYRSGCRDFRARVVSGWKKAKDGFIPDRYPVIELPGAGYAQRTRRNVADSDGTLILYFGEITGGTFKTLRLCKHLGKPVHTLNAATMRPDEACEQAMQFIGSWHWDAQRSGATGRHTSLSTKPRRYSAAIQEQESHPVNPFWGYLRGYIAYCLNYVFNEIK